MKHEDIEVGKNYKVAGGWIHFFPYGITVKVIGKRVEFEKDSEEIHLIDCSADGCFQTLLPEDLEEL